MMPWTAVMPATHTPFYWGSGAAARAQCERLHQYLIPPICPTCLSKKYVHLSARLPVHQLYAGVYYTNIIGEGESKMVRHFLRGKIMRRGTVGDKEEGKGDLKRRGEFGKRKTGFVGESGQKPGVPVTLLECSTPRQNDDVITSRADTKRMSCLSHNSNQPQSSTKTWNTSVLPMLCQRQAWPTLCNGCQSPES